MKNEEAAEEAQLRRQQELQKQEDLDDHRRRILDEASSNPKRQAGRHEGNQELHLLDSHEGSLDPPHTDEAHRNPEECRSNDTADSGRTVPKEKHLVHTNLLVDTRSSQSEPHRLRLRRRMSSKEEPSSPLYTRRI